MGHQFSSRVGPDENDTGHTGPSRQKPTALFSSEAQIIGKLRSEAKLAANCQAKVGATCERRLVTNRAPRFDRSIRQR